MNKLLRKITSVRIPDFQSVSLRQKALRCLAGFMFLMILLTLLSRAARSMTIAEAVLASPQKMTIDYNITANGRTVQDQETALSTLPNVKVKQVHVREGESVKAGDPLFTLDTEDLSAQILALNQEIEKMKLQAQEAASNNRLDQENKENSIARAREDYNTAKEKTDKLIQQAKQAMDEASQALTDFRNKPSQNGQNDILEGLKNAYNTALSQQQSAQDSLNTLNKELEETVKARIQEAQSGLSGNAILTEEEKKKIEAKARAEYEPLLSQADRTLKNASDVSANAKTALDQYQATVNSNAGEERKAQEKALEDDYNAKKLAYEDALASQAESLRQAERAIEDADSPKRADSSETIAKLELKEKEDALKKLEDMLACEGVVTSPADGLILKVSVMTGEPTSSNTSILLANADAGCRFTAQISAEDAKHLNRGDSVILKVGNDKKELKDLTIDTIEVNAENPDLYDISVSIPKGLAQIGSAAVLEATSRSKIYESCVPLSALHMEQNKSYLLIPKEVQTVLGSEWTVEKLEVTVLEKNGKYAALSPTDFPSGQKFVETSTKPLQTGDRIRLSEE